MAFNLDLDYWRKEVRTGIPKRGADPMLGVRGNIDGDLKLAKEV